MTSEETLYQDANIHVTNMRAMLQGKTYAMANVTSVSMFTQLANRAPGVLIAVIGAVFFLMGLPSSDMRGCAFFFGALLAVVGIAYAASQSNVYWVRIGSASGETNALSSRDRDYITRIVNAMNNAIVRRG